MDRLKIKDLAVGSSYTIPLVVQVGSARTTKAGKPYLALTLFDGTDTISGNYWDWNGVAVPPNDRVLDVTCQVTEWQSAKQLTIKGLNSNTAISISEFTPSSGVDVESVFEEALELMSTVTDDTLRCIAENCLFKLKPQWLEVPGAKAVHHAYAGGTLIHSLSVARIAKSIAEQVHGANVDLCVVGAMLHDLGKLFTYNMSVATIEMTSVGMLFDHTYIGTEFISNFAEGVVDVDDPVVESKLNLLKHVVLSHHGLPEHGAAVQPLCIEAIVVHNSDKIDASCEMIRAASLKAAEDAMWTGQVWALNNRPHLSTYYVEELMS